MARPTVRGLPRLARRMRRLPRLVLTRWRRSMRLRVVVATLLLSSTVVALVGVLLVHRIGAGLLADKRRAALADAASGLSYTQAQLQASARNDRASMDALVETVVTELGRRGSTSGLFDVAMLPSSGRGDGYTTQPLDISDLPDGLRQAVRTGAEAETYADVHRNGQLVEALLVGAPVAAPTGQYELYYVFPLTNEEQTLGLVRRVMALGGGLLVVLLAAVVALVVRQVVTPVRSAASIAERFAAGRLQERMRVRGEDEIARLASSFNHMAAALSRQIDQLEELSRLQRRFTADVSHELRTPLTTVRMAADVLYEARDEFSPALARAAELLRDQLERFEALLADLLEISRYDAMAAVLEPEQVDLAALTRSVVAEYADAAGRAGCGLDVSAVPSEPVLAQVDPRRVARIVRNLVANAVDHADGCPVQVALAATDGPQGVVAIRVRDHGVGLRPEDVDRVFDRFWRADPSRARTTGGTGLGLSIAVEDARLHGGELAAWGRPSQGAAFRLLLPRTAGESLGPSPLPLVPDDVDESPSADGTAASSLAGRR